MQQIDKRLQDHKVNLEGQEKEEKLERLGERMHERMISSYIISATTFVLNIDNFLHL